MPVSTMEVRLSRWREAFRLIGDPFEQYEADQEQDFLPNCFVDRPYLHNILGDPAHPQTAFLSAGSGEGKTATREMVVYECQSGFLRGKAFPIRYDSFEDLRSAISGDPSQVTLRDHVGAISRLLFNALRADVPATYFDRLQPFDADLLLGLAQTYASSVCMAWLRRALPSTASPIQGATEGLSPAETLRQLVDLVCQLGPTPGEHYQAVYILVDRVDEICKGSPHASRQALAPLVSENALLNRQRLAFKFFLPDDFISAIRGVLPISPEKVVFETINWDSQLLFEVINQRLRYFSEGAIENYEQLFTSDIRGARTKQRLIDRAKSSPRALIRLFNYMVHHHARRDLTARTALLDKQDLDEAVIQLAHDGEVSRTVQVTAAPSAAPAQPTTQGLFIDDNGHIWIDGQMLKSNLSNQELALLRELNRHQPGVVLGEELIHAVWPESRDSSEDPKGAKYDEQNLRKLVDRLREKLVTPGNINKNRFIRNARGRGYWLSVT